MRELFPSFFLSRSNIKERCCIAQRVHVYFIKWAVRKNVWKKSLFEPLLGHLPHGFMAIRHRLKAWREHQNALDWEIQSLPSGWCKRSKTKFDARRNSTTSRYRGVKGWNALFVHGLVLEMGGKKKKLYALSTRCIYLKLELFLFFFFFQTVWNISRLVPGKRCVFFLSFFF